MQVTCEECNPFLKHKSTFRAHNSWLRAVWKGSPKKPQHVTQVEAAAICPAGNYGSLPVQVGAEMRQLKDYEVCCDLGE